MPLPCNDGKSPMSSSLSMVIFPSGVIMIEKGIYKSVIGILTLAAKMIFLEFEVFHHQIPFLRGWNVSDNGQE